eukprot:1161903-Pelagomonas_calceolata.AAC.4
MNKILPGSRGSAFPRVPVLSGSLSGGLAAAVTSPIELIKTRLQHVHLAAPVTSLIEVVEMYLQGKVGV